MSRYVPVSQRTPEWLAREHERQRRRREKDREGLRAYMRAWMAARYRDDPEWRAKKKASTARYRKANPEKVKARNAQWRQKNREHVRAYMRAYREVTARPRMRGLPLSLAGLSVMVPGWQRCSDWREDAAQDRALAELERQRQRGAR